MEGLDMRTAFDLAPFRHSLIGFDYLFDLIENSAGVEQPGADLPYDVMQVGEAEYRIRLAVAGFGNDDIEITSHPNLLVIKCRRKDARDGDYLHRGIAMRALEKQFQLADHVIVTNASLADGMLEIDLKREPPEAAKPRKIDVKRAVESVGSTSQARQKEAA
jgi:molecular chaperone IbpA